MAMVLGHHCRYLMAEDFQTLGQSISQVFSISLVKNDGTVVCVCVCVAYDIPVHERIYLQNSKIHKNLI